MSTHFSKLNATIMGVTPFYYMHLSTSGKEAVNGLVRYMPVELTLNFIQVLEEMYNHIVALSNNDVKYKDPQDQALAESNEVMKYFFDSLDLDVLAWIPALIKIRNEAAESYTEVNFYVGNIDLQSLLKMTAPDVETRMKNEISRFMDGVDSDHTDLVIRFIDEGEELVNRLQEAIEVVNRKIKVIEDSYFKKNSKYLSSCYTQLLQEVAYIDHTMINSSQRDFIRTLRDNLRELGIDTRIPLYDSVKKQARAVEELTSRKEYNKATLVSLETKKSHLERSLVALVSKINGVRESIVSSKYYF